MVSLRDWYWGQCSPISLVGLSASSVSLLQAPSVAVDTSEGKGAIHRDLDMLEKWADANLMKFDNAKCKVLQLGHSNPIQTYRLGRAVTGSRPMGKGFAVMVDEKFDVRHHQKRCDQQDDRGDYAPLLCSWETSPGVLHRAVMPLIGST